MDYKKALKYSLKNIIKIGKRRGIQRYLCKDCKCKFQHKRRPEQLHKIIFVPQGHKKRVFFTSSNSQTI
ncbi:transposase-like zinc-binding domain-containing protein [Sulfurimonas sp.]|uniref:IS1/IS1595 family N-terminal zinc-binding domain-containing protein n=1 Tax=Sulfurimonas sp. TaxID=2022749 RepID=UPI002AB26F18|nr:hypothetical protein [Sulfurimonas sp.]